MFLRKTNYQQRQAFSKKPPRLMSVKYIENELDALVRLILPLMESCCFTCGTTKDLQVGHLFERRHRGTRWDTAEQGGNHRQCERCNCRHEETPRIYHDAFVKRFGERAFHDVAERAHSNGKITYTDMLEMLEQKEAQLKELKARIA